MNVSGGVESSNQKSDDGIMEVINGYLQRRPHDYNMHAINEKIKDKVIIF